MNRVYKIIIILTLLFIIDAIFVSTGLLTGLDDILYKFISSIRCDFFDIYFSNITTLGNVKVVLLILVILNIFLPKKDKMIVNILSINCVLTNTIIKYIFKRSRPSVERLIEIGGYSFPSGHSMITATLYGYLFYLVLKRVKNKILKIILEIILGCLIFSICISRIYVGVHYASDVLGGFTLGIIELMLTIHLSSSFMGGVDKDVQNISK